MSDSNGKLYNGNAIIVGKTPDFISGASATSSVRPPVIVGKRSDDSIKMGFGVLYINGFGIYPMESIMDDDH